jgi:uncharacterized protein (DUF1697 family)
MTTYIGLLRGVNLGPHNKIAMSDLRDIVTGLGMQDARTLLQSGNVMFRSNLRSATKVEQLLEQALEEQLGRATDVFVRTGDELKRVIGSNPFPEFAGRDPSHLVVVFLKAPVGQPAVAALQKAIPGREEVRADGRHMYIVYPDGIGRSRLGTLPEAKIASRGTARNWNTVLKLAAMASVS